MDELRLKKEIEYLDKLLLNSYKSSTEANNSNQGMLYRMWLETLIDPYKRMLA